MLYSKDALSGRSVLEFESAHNELQGTSLCHAWSLWSSQIIQHSGRKCFHVQDYPKVVCLRPPPCPHQPDSLRHVHPRIHFPPSPHSDLPSPHLQISSLSCS